MRTKKGMSGGVMGLLGVLLVGVVLVGTGTVNLSTFGGEDDTVPYEQATADLDVLAEGAETVYMAERGATMPDEYGDYTESASTIESDIDGDVYTVEITDGSGAISASDISPNKDFKPGETYKVFTDGTNANVEFDEVTIPAETDKFKVENQISEEVDVATLETPVDGETTEEIRTFGGDFAASGSDITTDSVSDKVSDIYDDGEMTYYNDLEVDDGTQVLGEVSSASVDAAVTDLSITVRADGSQVYSESASGDNVNDLVDDFRDEIERDPVLAEDSVTVEVDAEFDDTRTDADAAAGFVEFAIDDLYGSSVFDVNVTA